MLPISELAAIAVATLSPYLTAAGLEGAKKLGEAGAERLAKLYDKVKSRLTSPAGQEAFSDLHKSPQDADAQATVRQALKKELAADPAFHAVLAALVEELRSVGGIVQTSTITGDDNASAQIAGDNNQVTFGKLS